MSSPQPTLHTPTGPAEHHPDHDSDTDCDVLIAGAGVGGAALALALVARYPLRVLVVDRRGGPGNINRGDSLLPAVTAHLRAWGALPAMQAAGARPVDKMQVFHHRAGFLFQAPLHGAPLGDIVDPHSPADDPNGPWRPTSAPPYLVLPHPEIERALLTTATSPTTAARTGGQARVRYGCRLLDLLRTPDGRVCGAVVQQDGSPAPVRARLVVGADGSMSTVRALLQIPITHVPYDHGFYIVEASRPPAPRYVDAMRIELHPDGGILVVPQGPDRVGLGVLVHAREMDLFRAGPFPDKLAAIARRSPLFTGLRPADASSAAPPENPVAYAKGAHLYSLYRGHAHTYYRDGAVLIGDALHVTNPTAGQGMTMAIEDAASLAAHIGPALVSGLPIAPALAAYQADRHAKNQAQIRWSHWLSRFYALSGPVGDALHSSLFRLGATGLGQRLQRHIWSRMATRDPPADPSTAFPTSSSTTLTTISSSYMTTSSSTNLTKSADDFQPSPPWSAPAPTSNSPAWRQP